MMKQESNGIPISLYALLSGLGHEPVSRNGNELYYRNVFTDSGGTPRPSLTVDVTLDVWFDSSLGRGGNLMDFARTYWPDLSPGEIKERLHDIHTRTTRMANQKDRPRRKRKPTKIPHYQIDRTNPLGYNTEITDFLMESGLWELADLNIQEVHYFVIDQKGNRKDFHAAGWQNENGGWEVRAQHFESCLGPKGMTFISGSETVLAVFPDYVDYLKRRSDNHVPYASVLVLNHPDFIAASMRRASYFEKVLLYADERREGYGSLTETFVGEVPQTTVISIHQ